MAVSTGTFKVGAGQTYTNWAAAAADLAATLTGNIEFQQGANSADTAVGAFVTDLAGFNFTVSNNSAPAGDPTAGFKGTFSVAGSQTTWAFSNTGGACTVEMKDLNWDATVSSGTSAVVSWISLGAGVTAIVHDNLLEGENFMEPMKIFLSTAAGFHVYNNVFWGAASANGLQLRNAPTGSIIENNTSWGNKQGFDCSNLNVDVRNNLAFGNTTADFLDIATLTNGFNNVSEDATAGNANWGGTGTNNITGITPANEIISTDDTMENFMKAKAGGSIEDGGVTVVISGNDHGIRTNVRPHAGNFTIGADEIIVSGGKPVIGGVVGEVVCSGAVQTLVFT